MKQSFEDINDNGGATAAFFTGLFAGTVIGAGLALWFAPKTGAEMREQVSDTARQFGERASKTVNDLADRSREVFDRAREVMNTAGDQLGQVASTARRGAQNVASSAERSS
ncbi:MAG TPA: YtxH domain-containing protein [Vicinamibacterales bacterium]|nr:YtxH domain-containing protein [Vicinamibacterales bacterium]